jgi:hypothetical protein
MCPACVTNVLLMTASASSTGGLTALALKELFGHPSEIIKSGRLEENKMKIETMERKKTGISGVSPHKIVSKAEWLVARKDLLKREKELAPA